jgi:hypothetical protein
MSIMVREARVVPGRSFLRLAVVVLFYFIGSLDDPVNAAVYECKGSNGSKVLTDRPKGLQGCVLIETLAPSPSGTGAPRTEPQALGQGQDNPTTPVPVPFPVIPQPSPRPMPHDPMQSGSISDQSAASSGHESKACPPGINPLNPLARGRCSPGASESAPSSTQEPQQSPQ